MVDELRMTVAGRAAAALVGMGRFRLLCVVLAVALLCLAAPPSGTAQSGFYRWVDEDGSIRYTDNPATIPRQHLSSIERYGDEHAAGPEDDSDAQVHSGRRRVVVNYNARGGSIFVHAVLNRYHPAVMQLDTGASRTMITEDDARMLNVSIDSDRSVRGLIADGSIVELPVVSLAALQVGEALIENIEVTVGKLRLLGMDFLQHFELTIDDREGRLVLTARDLGQPHAGLEREPESDVVRQDREQARRDIDNQISQFMIAIKTHQSVIAQYRDDILDADRKHEVAVGDLAAARDRSRFQSSGISRDDDRDDRIARLEKTVADIDAYIENRRDMIRLQQEQISGMQNRIAHLRRVRARID